MVERYELRCTYGLRNYNYHRRTIHDLRQLGRFSVRMTITHLLGQTVREFKLVRTKFYERFLPNCFRTHFELTQAREDLPLSLEGFPPPARWRYFGDERARLVLGLANSRTSQARSRSTRFSAVSRGRLLVFRLAARHFSHGSCLTAIYTFRRRDSSLEIEA